MKEETLKEAFMLFGLAVLFYVFTMNDIFPVIADLIKGVFWIFSFLLIVLGVSTVINGVKSKNNKDKK